MRGSPVTGHPRPRQSWAADFRALVLWDPGHLIWSVSTIVFLCEVKHTAVTGGSQLQYAEQHFIVGLLRQTGMENSLFGGGSVRRGASMEIGVLCLLFCGGDSYHSSEKVGGTCPSLYYSRQSRTRPQIALSSPQSKCFQVADSVLLRRQCSMPSAAHCLPSAVSLDLLFMNKNSWLAHFLSLHSW